jgi:hypothetical protein
VYWFLLFWLTVLSRALATELITACDEDHLIAALGKGGSIRFACDGVIALTRPLVLSTNVDLDAIGHDVALDAQGTNRILEIKGQNATIANIRFLNGNYLGAAGSIFISTGKVTLPEIGEGAAILIQRANVTLSDCTFSNNFSKGGSGAWDQSFNGEYPIYRVRAASGRGGAISCVDSSVSLSNCFFISNVTVGGESQPVPDLSFNVSTGAGDALGGALYSSNSVFAHYEVLVWQLRQPGSERVR